MRFYILLQIASIAVVFPFEKNLATTFADGGFIYLIALCLLSERKGDNNIFYMEYDNDAVRVVLNELLMIIKFALLFALRLTLNDSVYYIYLAILVFITVAFNTLMIAQSTLH